MIEVSRESIDNTTKCDRNFECLTEGNAPRCEISNCIGCAVYFVKNSNKYCSYGEYYGFDKYCTCPVRQEIYNKYSI